MKAEIHNGLKLKVLRIDGGCDYNSTEFRKLCEENAHEHEVTAPYTSQHNDLVERRN